MKSKKRLVARIRPLISCGMRESFEITYKATIAAIRGRRASISVACLSIEASPGISDVSDK